LDLVRREVIDRPGEDGAAGKHAPLSAGQAGAVPKRPKPSAKVHIEKARNTTYPRNRAPRIRRPPSDSRTAVKKRLMPLTLVVMIFTGMVALAAPAAASQQLTPAFAGQAMGGIASTVGAVIAGAGAGTVVAAVVIAVASPVMVPIAGVVAVGVGLMILDGAIWAWME
jgi:hypothetical protein